MDGVWLCLGWKRWGRVLETICEEAGWGRDPGRVWGGQVFIQEGGQYLSGGKRQYFNNHYDHPGAHLLKGQIEQKLVAICGP